MLQQNSRRMHMDFLSLPPIPEPLAVWVQVVAAAFQVIALVIAAVRGMMR
jgi:hypothetical protein